MLSYVFYWLAVIVTLIVMKYKEVRDILLVCPIISANDDARVIVGPH